MASDHAVDYDTIINVQTLHWDVYDTEAIFDLAGHDDFDVHISLLYDVGEDEAEDYTGIRVGYPAGTEDRLGFITPPQSPRKFQEEKISGLVSESAHRYIGDISVSPTGTRRGVKQALVLKNTTGVMELSLTDSPIKNEIGKIFDASEWIDQVSSVPELVRDSRGLPDKTIFTSFDKLDFINRLYDEVEFNFEQKYIMGDVFLDYKDDKLHIKEARVEFFGGLDPSSYQIYGVGDWLSARSPLRLSVKQYPPSRQNFDLLRSRGSIRFYLLVKDRTVLTGDNDYRWVSLDYGFGDSNWRSEYINRSNYVNVAQSIPGGTTYGPPLPINLSTSKYWADDIDRVGIKWATGLAGVITSTTAYKSFGTVIGGSWYDTISPPQSMKMSLSSSHSSVPQIYTSLTDYRQLLPSFILEDLISPPQKIMMSYTSTNSFGALLVSW